MPEESNSEENIDMNRSRYFSNYLFFIITLLFSISCLVASEFVVVDRGHGNAPDIVYSDVAKKEFLAVSDRFPCADLDEYDNIDVPILGDNKPRQYEPKFNDDLEPNENSFQNGDKKEELESNKNTDADVNSKVEDDWERSKENDVERKDLDSDESESFERNEESDEKPSAGNKSDERNNHEVPQESEEDPMEESHSDDCDDSSQKRPQARKITTNQKKLVHSQNAEPQTLKDQDDETEISESRETRNHKLNDQEPQTFRQSTHRHSNKARLSKKREPQTRDDSGDESEVASSHRRSKRKKRLRVLGKRHRWDVNRPMTPALSKRDAAIDVDDWGYCGDMGPEKWQEKWPDCGGNAQSPINLDTSTAKIDYEPVLKWKGYSNTPSKMTLINNGHSVVLTTSYEDCGNKPYIWDSIMNHEYVFGELTFHWGADESSGSEHTVNYLKYPLEMQVVHYRRELGSIEKAQEVPGGIAVVGILFHVDDGKRQNQGIADILTGFSKVRDGPASTSIQPFPLSRVVPQFSKHYLSYNGSMTTPPCTETVIWLVHLKQASISKKQLGKFHRLKNEGVEIKQNNRPIQKTNKRCVLEIT